MADDSYLGQVLGWLKGSPTSFSTSPSKVELAPTLPQYPTSHDADYARNYGFGDNNINEDYLNNNKARVLGNAVPMQTSAKDKNRQSFVQFAFPSGITRGDISDMNSITQTPVDLNENPSLQGKLTNTMMRAALAANRSPIAAVGFDPSKVIVDSLTRNPNFGGFTPVGSNPDVMFTTLHPDDSIVHESMHRGLQKLRDQYPEAKGILSTLPQEEFVVRWLMQNQAGDPEGFNGKVDADQRDHGKYLFNDAYTAKHNREQLDRLQELAIDAMKNRGKRAGPQ